MLGSISLTQHMPLALLQFFDTSTSIITALLPLSGIMSSRLPSDWRVDEVVVKENFELSVRGCRGTYRGTVNGAGEPHGRGDFDGEGGIAVSSDWRDGEATGEGWWRHPWGGGAIVYAGAVRGGGPHGYGIYHCSGGRGRFEGESVSGLPVGEGVMLLAGPMHEVWRVRIDGGVNAFSDAFWGGSYPVRRLERLGRVTEGGPSVPRREDGGRFPGPEWAATVELPDGSVVRGRWRRLTEVRGMRPPPAPPIARRVTGCVSATRVPGHRHRI
jgi:hypothetical protein